MNQNLFLTYIKKDCKLNFEKLWIDIGVKEGQAKMQKRVTFYRKKICCTQYTKENCIPKLTLIG